MVRRRPRTLNFGSRVRRRGAFGTMDSLSRAGRRVRARTTRIVPTAWGVRGAALARAARWGSAGMALYSGYSGLRAMSTWARRRRKAWKIGNRIGSSTAKHDRLEDADQIATKTLNDGLRLLSLPGINNNETILNQRAKQVVNFRGIKFCVNLEIDDITGRGDKKVFFNMALISPKALDNDNLNIPSAEFFRGVDDKRYADFTATALTGMDCHCLGINTDKYIVHFHKKYILGPWESTEGKGERYVEFYYPVKRQIRYNADGTGIAAEYPEGKDMWWVYWCAETDEGTAPPLANRMTVRYRIVRYFRDPGR